MRYAIVRDGLIENLVEWDGDAGKWSPPDGASAHEFPTGAAAPGWPWNGGNPSNPNPPPEPEPTPDKTPAEKLAASTGLTVDELKALIAGK